MRQWGVALAGLSLVFQAPVLHAQPKDQTPASMAEHLAAVGTWDFASRKKGTDGEPECRETWFFASDGTGWVQSGEQRVTLTWVVEQGDKTDRILWRKSLSSTAGPDCMGRMADPDSYPREEEVGFVVMFFNSGGALTCQPAPYILNEDGTRSDMRMLRDEDCWGSLEAAAQGDS
jgi:hypothetical protein